MTNGAGSVHGGSDGGQEERGNVCNKTMDLGVINVITNHQGCSWMQKGAANAVGSNGAWLSCGGQGSEWWVSNIKNCFILAYQGSKKGAGGYGKAWQEAVGWQESVFQQLTSGVVGSKCC